ncbi:MAG TPA: efflux RND transporter permease subunit [Terriglobales bacterium]|jgi:multidrug efflux pump|nr:efflux RND transporter permease subunit [Terriglobales bacterium]
MSISRPFILRPIATSLLMVGLLLVGIVAYRQLPISALPQVDYPTIQVVTFYPGASPDVTASSITAPLERQFGELPGLSQMTSSSSFGASVVTLQFDLNENIDIAEQEVQAAINSAQTFLPNELPTPPIYSKVNPADAPILTLAMTSDSMPLPQVEDLADTTFAQKISQLPGVGLVSISGGQKPAVRILANPTALASYGMSLEQLRNVIGQVNIDQAKGQLQDNRQSFTIGANDQLLDPQGYADTIVAYKNGNPVRLSDVAQVVMGAENANQAAWMNTTPAVILNIQRQPGANIIKVVDSIKLRLDQLKRTLPASVKVQVLTDRTSTIRASVKDVEFEMMLTIALVVMVIFLFLRTLSATIIPSVTVPLSIVGTFGVMYLLGYSLDNLSLMALTISTGFVVDDAIVMIENIDRFIEEGHTPLEAALRGAGQIGFTIVSLTVSLIAVLIPLLFMGDIVGRLFREFAVTLAVTILLSAVISLTLTPMMCSLLLRQRDQEKHSKLYDWSERVFNNTIAFYGRTVKFVLNHQTATLLVTIGTLIATIYLYIVVPKGFFPVQDTGVIMGISDAPESISFKAMSERQQALAAAILKDKDVESLSSFIGVDGTNTTPNSGRVQINLKSRDERTDDVTTIMKRLQQEVAGVEGITLYMQPVQDLTVEDRVSRTQYQFTLEDADSKELRQWTAKMMDKLKTLPELRDVATDQQNQAAQASLVIDRDTAMRLGVTASAIDNTLYDAFGQRLVSIMFTQLNQYHVVLEVDPAFAADPDSLKSIYVPAGGGQSPVSTGNTSIVGTPINTTNSANPMAATANQVPLSAIAHWETTNGPLTINHQGQFPAVTISFNLGNGASLGDAVKAIERTAEEIGMPASIQLAFQGTARAFQASLANEGWLILAAIVTVYIVLGVLYESYIHPITILSTLPSAGVGAILALSLFRMDLSVMALIGIILLIGIVKKNAIMMIDFALEAERKEGKPPVEAIYEACLLRFRPIMMTTFAALFGAVPLALGSGTGSELRRPLGITIVGGLLFSQVLTLYTTPVVYLWFDRLAQALRNLRSPKPAEAIGD